MLKKRIEYKLELMIWSVYFATIVLSVYIHELGHCIPAWIYGYWAVPTFAKEYVAVPVSFHQYVALGGPFASIFITLMIIILYLIKTFKFDSAILAGTLTTSGFYSLMFIFKGGRGDVEFHEAQTALGINYTGHFLDWFFLILFLFGVFVWIVKSKPNYKILGRLLTGLVLTIVFMVFLQDKNNTIFDPIFQSKTLIGK
jgi:hypothetical protein